MCVCVTSQGATGAAGSHLPAAKGEPGGTGGGDRGRHGGADEAVLPLMISQSINQSVNQCEAEVKLSRLSCSPAPFLDYPMAQTL